MWAAVFKGPGAIQVEEVDEPGCGELEAVIRVALCGVCGTDRSIFRGEYDVRAPIVLGHEYAGTVVEVGRSVVGFEIGDRVAVDPNVVDDVCFYCRRGLSHLCQGLRPLGVAQDGGFAELSVVPARYLHKIPDPMSFAEACLIEPLACCVRGIDQAAISAGDLVVVSGAGPIGCLLVQLARLSGATTVVSVEPRLPRQKFAAMAGADVVCTPKEAVATVEKQGGGVGADVVIEASGQLEAAEGAFELVRRGGTVLLFGVYPQTGRIPVNPFRINEDELRVVGSLNNPSTHSRALDLIASRRVNVENVVSDQLPLADLRTAMDRDNFPAAGKIVIDLRGADREV
jgi:2-desacetyl-2-hydroxyethyl bacteriochlorophyllide A dehydrogenase